MSVRAVIFDLGGVVLESPLHFLADYEKLHGLPMNLIARLVGSYGGADGAWQRLERGEVTIAEFCRAFDEDLQAAGVAVKSQAMMEEMASKSVVRGAMLSAIRALREAGLVVAALTNNWAMGADHDERMQPLRDEFDHFVESCKVGMRKPEARIYELTLGRLGLPAEATVFLDDIGGNLKAARALGMATIKVDAPERALADLGTMVGLKLV